MKKIAVIGLGYVGLPLAVEFGKIRRCRWLRYKSPPYISGWLGFDVIKSLCAIEMKSCFQNTCNFLVDNLDRLAGAQIFIITVPTPIDAAKRPELKPLRDASETVGRVLKAGDIVIYESTVFPGATEEICVPILESVSGLKFNQDFFCGYSPERINPGDKVNTLTKIPKNHKW